MKSTQDLIGQKFGKYSVLNYIHTNGRMLWECECECGNRRNVSRSELVNGHSTQCKRCANRERSKNLRVDLTGRRFGRFVALSFAYSHTGASCWTCQCDCGTIKVVLANSLTSGKTLSCGCYMRQRASERNSLDITGNRYGRLVALTRINVGYDGVNWECQCDCGNTMVCSVHRLRAGNTRSCGCYKKERTSETHVKNMIGTRIGKFVVIEDCGSDEQGGKMWKCKCDCGNIFIAPGRDLRYGKYVSCGCYKLENARMSAMQPENCRKRSMALSIRGMQLRGELNI